MPKQVRITNMDPSHYNVIIEVYQTGAGSQDVLVRTLTLEQETETLELDETLYSDRYLKITEIPKP